MVFKKFQDLQLSALGFGCMRLPLMNDGSGNIDEEHVARMVECAIESGVNYFDTAYPYHGGMSELVMGRVLGKYPRDSFYLASKYPGHQISSSYDPAAVFEHQLKKCGVDYFDFYLLHNVDEKSVATYRDSRWGIVDYFVEQKRLGRIRHLGFSSHGRVELLEDFLNQYGDLMEFCQIQLNYLDWSLQKAKAKYELLTKRGIPVWVMEPLRGGKLAKMGEADAAKLAALRPDEGIPAWAFRWLQGLDNVTMVLSGMSSLEQMQDNIRTYSESRPTTEMENAALYEIAAGLAQMLPCTACRYCCDGCPKGLDIPNLLSLYNDLRFMSSMPVIMGMEGFDPDKRPDACIACGKCVKICPQNIDIPAAMKDFAERLSKERSWTEICAEREAAAKKMSGK